eukprot:scaffold217424_cov31-Tisochrysis_lutea.AAC.1
MTSRDEPPPHPRRSSGSLVNKRSMASRGYLRSQEGGYQRPGRIVTAELECACKESGVRWEIRREVNPESRRRDVLADLHFVGLGATVCKRSKAGDHLVNENSERPPVGTKAVASLHDHFWSEVFDSPNHGIGALDEALGIPKIDEFDDPCLAAPPISCMATATAPTLRRWQHP